MLKGNSEAGFLLCVPLRADDGTVFGICGIEVSDRLFKSLYTPTGGNYENIFTVMSPRFENGLLTFTRTGEENPAARVSLIYEKSAK